MAEMRSPAGSAKTDAMPSPPADPPEGQWTRRWIILSFWAIIVCFGLPHWLMTTSTYRASLPLDAMNSWAREDQICGTTDALALQESRDNSKAFKYSSTYHLTFSLFTPAAIPSDWDIDQALAQYIRPLIRALSNVSDFTVETQVQLHASFSPSIAGPQFDHSNREWQLQKSDLRGFINAAEWPLSPSIGAGPTINFVLYVPTEGQKPLVIAEANRATSWLIPQWGGVAILNTLAKQSTKLTAAELELAMLTFTEQLATLIGLPSNSGSLDEQVLRLKQNRAVSLIRSTSSTLDTVAHAVQETLSRLEQACDAFRSDDWDSALQHARIGNDEIETAFFEPSMVGQVYFPDEHKVAVYVPLLGPMAVPLIMAAIKEIRTWRQRRKAKTT
ncbi:GPI transamidase component [Recurvomyces mirabilis]|uniref:GPI transamidase component n=1 Tax=Recurvomyces mirabilis TaxID=574656 RepID=A0AAE0WN98_9PEZI|nr:GPI transamidase component [Recurvomyces mirabilis]KAK5157735.1 GPI transamidase component [Recurvomyces mirabilis]